MKQVLEGPETSRIALIALGSNAKSIFGDVEETVLKARDLLIDTFSQPIKWSGLYRTPAFPAGAGPDFVNAAMAVETTATIADVMDLLHRTEAAADRTRDQRWGARTLDLDLIALGDAVRPDRKVFQRWFDLSLDDQRVRVPDQTILPHPRVQDRSFVLVPLADIAPDWVHPVTRHSVRDMLAARPASERAEVVRLTP